MRASIDIRTGEVLAGHVPPFEPLEGAGSPRAGGPPRWRGDSST